MNIQENPQTVNPSGKEFYLTVAETAKILRCTPNHIYVMIRQGKIPRKRTSKRSYPILVPASYVYDYSFVEGGNNGNGKGKATKAQPNQACD